MFPCLAVAEISIFTIWEMTERPFGAIISNYNEISGQIMNCYNAFIEPLECNVHTRIIKIPHNCSDQIFLFPVMWPKSLQKPPDISHQWYVLIWTVFCSLITYNAGRRCPPVRLLAILFRISSFTSGPTRLKLPRMILDDDPHSRSVPDFAVFCHGIEELGKSCPDI